MTPFMEGEHALVTWFCVDQDLNVLARGLAHVVADGCYKPVSTPIEAVAERSGTIAMFVLQWPTSCSLSVYSLGILVAVAQPANLCIGDTVTPGWAEGCIFSAIR